jgi:hypothetical protein
MEQAFTIIIVWQTDRQTEADRDRQADEKSHSEHMVPS